jgi:hypothetical protein
MSSVSLLNLMRTLIQTFHSMLLTAFLYFIHFPLARLLLWHGMRHIPSLHVSPPSFSLPPHLQV